MTARLTPFARREIGEILNRRANEVAGFLDKYRRDSDHFGSVELALTREIDRLRRLAEQVDPTPEDNTE